MFTPEERAVLRSELLARAVKDGRISGGAITGSAALDREDRWSDIDLAFGAIDAAEIPQILSDWTAYLYERHGAVHHLDVLSGVWTYRVFLLPSTLQVDLAFVCDSEFRALTPAFRLVFGNAIEPLPVSPPSAEYLIGFAWLYAVHARTCIARGKFWQAEYMISGVRDNALALACLRHDLPSDHGRGMDSLPPEVTARFKDALVRSLDLYELARAVRVVMDGLMAEVRLADAHLADKLETPLRALLMEPSSASWQPGT